MAELKVHEKESLAPPTDFKRMLSWQLSMPTNLPVKRSQKKSKRKRKKSDLSSGGEEDGHHLTTDLITNEEDGYVYVIVNSDGEDEVYYSAPESPLSSGEEDALLNEASSPVATESISLPQSPGSRVTKKSKRSKKKARYLAKLANVEFFQPLCNLVEDKLSMEDLDVGKLELSSLAKVPSLVETCIKKIRQEALTDAHAADSLPFLIHSLLCLNRQQSSIIATHVRWLERLLANYQKKIILRERERQERPATAVPKVPCEQRAYILQTPWLPDEILPRVSHGLHCPLPEPVHTMYDSESDDFIQRFLLHFTNYFFPLFATGSGHREDISEGSLSPAQLAAVHYVENFIKTRYKDLYENSSEFLKLWPGYVYWARGQAKLASNAFIRAIELLKHDNDKAATLNELGRMFSLFGDRSSACRFFHQSALLAGPEEKNSHANDLFPVIPSLIQVSSYALEASVWDCGSLSQATAREAARAWNLVIKELDSSSFDRWYLHTAACESRLFVHAGKPVGGDPNSPLTNVSPPLNHSAVNIQWLNECVELLTKHTSSHPVLNYHLSLVHALLGNRDSSKKAWLAFQNDYYFNHEWPEWVQNKTQWEVFVDSTVSRAQYNPWQPLLNMLSKQCLSVAPVMQLCWRVRLLHPRYPYYFSNYHRTSMLADHSTAGLGLRLTSEGHLSADIHMDLPPMRCVLIDPYTGALCFSRSASLKHYYLNPLGTADYNWAYTYPDRYLLPWPVRLFESDHCVVELLMASTMDLEMNASEANYHASLHFYNEEGAHRKLDLRRSIRKELRQTILRLADKWKIKDAEETLDKLMELGRLVQVQTLKEKFKPKYTTRKDKHGKTYKNRTYNVVDFNLRLKSSVVFGRATLMMCFSLAQNTEISHWVCGQVLVFVNCSSGESFSRPKVYCVGDNYGFQKLCPAPDKAYPDGHFKHIKFATAIRTETTDCQTKRTNELMVFDENGDVVYQNTMDADPLNQRMTLSVGERLFTQQKANLYLGALDSGVPAPVIYSYTTEWKQDQESLPFKDPILAFMTVPGLLFVCTEHEVGLFHPGSLQTVPVELHLDTPSSTATDGNTEEDDTAPFFAELQFKMKRELFFEVLRVWDIEGCGSLPAESQLASGVCPPVLATEDERRPSQEEAVSGGSAVVSGCGSEDFGSCRVAFVINNRLLVIVVPHRTECVRLVLDLKLPGKITELHPMGKSGYMLSVTQFPDLFREEIYWLSETGRLLGVLPCVGSSPRSFFSATLQPRVAPSNSLDGQAEEESGGLYVFFNDGHGGIACLRPTTQ